jgi:hypothetical protein
MPAPIVTATCQAAVLSTASNLLAQMVEARQEGRPFAFDFTRLLRFVAFTFISTPPNFMWQQLLEKTFPAYLPATSAHQRKHEDDMEMKGGIGDGIIDGDPGSQRVQERSARFSLRNMLTKWFVDCITLGAIMNTIAFLVIMDIMKGQGGAQIMSNIKTVCNDYQCGSEGKY